MQKKIMLALIMSSSLVYAQEVTAPTEAALSQSSMGEQETTTVTTPTSQASMVPPAAEQATPEIAKPAQETPEKVAQQEQPPMPAPSAASEPQPSRVIEPQPVAIEPEEDLEIKGIDTVDISEAKGNWLYKRIWWEKAEHTYEKIKQLTDKIIDSRMSFFLKRNEIDRLMFEFYADVGFRQGELAELISYLTRQLEQERKDEGSLNEKEREVLDMLNQEKKNVEQMQQGIQTIGKIDGAIEDALLKLIEQLNQAKYYEQQAWQILKAINRELSDKKARELFYTMDTYWRNLNSINTYLSDAFTKYFEQLLQKLQQESDKIKTSVQALSEKGINLQAQSLAMKRECKMPAKEEEPQEAQTSTGFLGTIWNIITAPVRYIGSAFGGIFDWVSSLFGGTSEEVVLAKPARQAAE